MKGESNKTKGSAETVDIACRRCGRVMRVPVARNYRADGERRDDVSPRIEVCGDCFTAEERRAMTDRLKEKLVGAAGGFSP